MFKKFCSLTFKKKYLFKETVDEPRSSRPLISEVREVQLMQQI